ncbi:MAG TPA: hypothetical protein VJT11_08640 [Nitrospiraceae bacterium]|nr:hypothetical protein [Nitrospiraceae bacterium]
MEGRRVTEGAHNGVHSDDVVEVREPEAREQRNHHRAWEAGTMKVDRKTRWKMFWAAGAAMALVAGMVSTVPSAYAGGTIKVDDDKWISVGMGTRLSFNAVEDGSASGNQWSNSFGVNNARIYIDGGIHKYVKFTFNTECFNCSVGAGGAGFGSNATVGMLDAIGKFEFNELVNFWVGRTLVPTERGELNGPFYHAVFDGFRTPFNQADFSGNFGAGGAGIYGRDNGAVFYGKVHPFGTHLQYVASVFTGLQSAAGVGPNQRNKIKYAGRLTWNLLNDESNPGYYTSGTYYGAAGDILAIAAGGEYQEDGSGSFANPNNFTSFVTDLLFEKVLGTAGVFTVNAELKRYWSQNVAAFGNADCFCMFGGTSWTAYALYLFPQQIGIGKFQPYARYTGLNAEFAGSRLEWEFGMNYVIAGHNARISSYWRTGDIGGTGTFNGQNLNYAPGSTGQHVDTWVLAVQLQY